MPDERGVTHIDALSVITGFSELGPGRLEAVYVAEERGGKVIPAGQVQFGLARTRLWEALDQIARRAGDPARLRPGSPRAGSAR